MRSRMRLASSISCAAVSGLVRAACATVTRSTEAGANEVDEESVLEELAIAHEEIKKLCRMMNVLREKLGKPKRAVVVPAFPPELKAAVDAAEAAAIDVEAD